MLDLICRIIWAVIVIANITYIAIGKENRKWDSVFIFTSIFIWMQGLIYMLKYAIMGVI